jgi:ribosomal protein S18 acetylase RimI-like enzyme
MLHEIYHKLGTMHLAVLDVTPYWVHPNYIITRISVPTLYRGQGHGRALLRELCADADAQQAHLFLEISASGPLDNDALFAWYERNGFSGHVTGMLYRAPKFNPNLEK